MREGLLLAGNCHRPQGQNLSLCANVQNEKSNLWLLFERSAASAQRVLPDSLRQTRFFGDFLVADKKVTRLLVRQADLCQKHSAEIQKIIPKNVEQCGLPKAI